VCGIAGKVLFSAGSPAPADVVAAMTAALAHRGPDDHDLVSAGSAAFGHRRLAIVDLSPAGRQPMTREDGQLMAVVNGELYNHEELRAELAAAGHRFAGRCDVEVLLPLYLEHWEREGPDFVARLEGMFAFAIWDGRHRRLILGRDRAGQKPVAYCATERGLSFASELHALRLDPDLDRTPDDGALADYLAFRCVPHPKAAWRGAAKLPPAHVLVAEGGQVRTHRYWRLAPGPEHGDLTLDEAAEELQPLLASAVQRRLMADVPLGALLSGGVDSATVVALMAQQGAGRVSTFTMGFDDPAYDETVEARGVARLFDTDHTERIVAPDALSLLDAVVHHHGEPFADSSALPTFLVCAMAAEKVKVVLTGDGGDEAFGGYDRHRALLLAQRLDHGVVRAAVGLAASAAAVGGVGGQRSVSARLRRFADALSAPPRRRNHAWRLAGSAARLAALLTPEGAERLGNPSHYGPDLGGPLPLNEALLLDGERYLPDDVLVKVDVASMASSLEARAPLLDHRVLAFAASLPANLKATARHGKRVLRRAMRRLLPADVVSGRKRGFGVPLDRWMRGPLLDHLREVLLSPRATARGLFEPTAVARLIEDHAAGRLAAHEQLFTLLVLERWFLAEEEHP
jgi:asparagine synthase (glutamine-hydrolysing)